MCDLFYVLKHLEYLQMWATGAADPEIQSVLRLPPPLQRYKWVVAGGLPLNPFQLTELWQLWFWVTDSGFGFWLVVRFQFTPIPVQAIRASSGSRRFQFTPVPVQAIRTSSGSRRFRFTPVLVQNPPVPRFPVQFTGFLFDFSGPLRRFRLLISA